MNGTIRTAFALTLAIVAAVGISVDLRAEEIIKSFPAPWGYQSYGLTWDGQHLWCGDDYHGSIAQVDTADGSVLATIPGAYESNHGLAWDGTHLWVSGDYHTDYIYRITTTGVRVDSILNPGGDYSGGLEWDGQYLWVSRYYPNTQPNLFKVNVTTGASVDTIPSRGLQPQGLAWDGHALWNVQDDNDGDPERVWALDPTTGDTLTSFPVPSTGTSGESPRGLAWDGRYLWLVSKGPGTSNKYIYKIDPLGGGTPEISLSNSQYDYGHTIIGNPAVFLLGIFNTGSADLVVDSVCCATPVFTYPDTFPQTVPPGSAFYLPITFSPVTWGSEQASLTAYSNDPVGDPPAVDLTGWGVWPDQEIGLASGSHDYGAVRMGADKRWFLHVQNEGAEPLILYSAATARSVFQIRSTQFPVQIDSTEAFDVDVWFHPPVAAAYVDTLTLLTNDADEPVVDVPLAGEGDGVGYPAGTVLWSYAVSGSYSDKVTSIRTIRDVDGDGKEDVIAAAEDYHTYCFHGNGSGTADTLWSFDTSVDPLRTGSVWQDFAMTPIEDLDGDNVYDVVIGTAGGCRSVIALSGATGTELWRYDSHEYGNGGWIDEVAPIEDIDGDGVPDVLAAAEDDGNSTGPRRAYCFSGADGTKIWERFLSASVFCVRAIDDLTGDGKDEVAAGTTAGIAYILNGVTGAVLHQYDTGGRTVWSVAAIEDVSGDGKKDVVLGLGDLAGDGWVHVVDSATMTSVWAFPTNVGGIVTEVHVIGDQNGDSVDDVIAGGVMYNYFVLDGATGSYIWSHPSPHKAFAVAAVPDLSGDLRDDVVGGSGYSVNRVDVMTGDAGAVLWSYTPAGPVETVYFLKSIDAGPACEILVGTRAGEILCLAGGETLTEVAAGAEPVPAGPLSIRAYPNPFNPATTIVCRVPEAGPATLAVYDVLGRCVRTLVEGAAAAGEHSAVWDGLDRSGTAVAPGVYFARLESGGRAVTQKIVLAK